MFERFFKDLSPAPMMELLAAMSALQSYAVNARFAATATALPAPTRVPQHSTQPPNVIREVSAKKSAEERTFLCASSFPI